MKISFPWRKILCFFCLFLLFVVHNSFLYEVFDLQQIFTAGTGEDQVQQPVTAQEGEAAQTEADEEELYTLEDIMDAQQNSSSAYIDEYSTENENQQMSGEDVLSALHKSEWNLILVNKLNPIPEDYTFTLDFIKESRESMRCDERILPQLSRMMQAAKEDGVTLIIRSPYRNDARQENLFNNKVKAYMKNKMSYLESFRKSAQAVNIPGSSEHQIGLALDFVTESYTKLEQPFADTDAGKWLAQNSYRYGFILRYPKGKEDITGIEYEPWHFRYVDVPAATYIYENDLTLEEFVQLLPE